MYYKVDSGHVAAGGFISGWPGMEMGQHGSKASWVELALVKLGAWFEDG